MHLFAPEVGLMGTSGIVGPSILQATGAGYSFKLLKTDRYRGGVLRRRGRQQRGLPRRPEHGLDLEVAGAVRVREQRVRHRGAVPYSAAGNPSVAGRGAAYGMPGVEVDGNDVVAVRKRLG